MKKIDLKQYVPLGIDYKAEIKRVCVVFAVGDIYSLGFLFSYYKNYDDLFYWHGGKKILVEGVIMPDFVSILNNYLMGFAVIILYMAALAVYYYAYHYLGSKSVYLMKRLPEHYELLKRCIIFPLAISILCIFAAFMLMSIYFGVYMWITPNECLMPGQWQKIWGIYN